MSKFILILSILFSIFIEGDECSIKKTNIASFKFEDYGACRYKNGIIYTVKDNNNNSGLYFSEVVNKDELLSVKKIKIPKGLNLVSIYSNEYIEVFDEFYFTARKLNKFCTTRMSIFKCKIKDFELVDVEKLKLLDSYVDCFHPTFSEDGLKMIMSTYTRNNVNNAKLELYSRLSQESEWLFERSLFELNLPGNELYSELVNDSLLVFSSTGKTTFNDFDLYFSKLNKDGKWSAPQLLSQINSEYNDFGIKFWDEKTGYFCSDRRGSDDIYYFEMNGSFFYSN